MSAAFSVYICAPYTQASYVSLVIHERLRAMGIEPTSTWAESADGPEVWARFSPEFLRVVAERNDADLERADVAFLFDPTGEGRETYAEGRFAVHLGKPTIWLSDRAVSRWRPGVIRVADLEEAFGAIEALRVKHAEGLRGALLFAVAS